MYTPLLAGIYVWGGLFIFCMYHATCHFVGLFIPHWYYAFVWVIYTLVSHAYMLGLCIPFWHDAYILGLFIPCFYHAYVLGLFFPCRHDPHIIGLFIPYI